MGYLDGSSITVDAILTKHGRKKLADGQGLNISQFALSDDGVDYNLWNFDHPSGSASYGQAITDLPQLEAVPDDVAIMKYKLLTMPRSALYLPFLDCNGGDDVTLPLLDSTGMVSCQTQNTEHIPAAAGESYHFLVYDVNIFSSIGGAAVATNMDQAYGNVLYQQDIPNAGLFSGQSLTLVPEGMYKDKTVTVQVTGQTSGAVTYVNVTVKKNTEN
jgi:hypothetical protein